MTPKGKAFFGGNESKLAKEKTETKVKEKRKIFQKKEKKQEVKIQPKVIEIKKVKVPKKQLAMREKKSKLAVKGRQTKWSLLLGRYEKIRERKKNSSFCNDKVQTFMEKN